MSLHSALFYEVLPGFEARSAISDASCARRKLEVLIR